MQHPSSTRRHWLGLAAAGLLAGPGRAQEQRREQRLEFWTMQLSPQLDDYVNGLLRAFEAAHPGTSVHWVDLPWAEAERKLLTAVAAGAAPDLVNLNPQFSAKLAEFGALADPLQYLSAAEQAAFLPAALQANVYREKCFGLPWYLSTNLTLYNRELFERAGLAAPSSHAELLDQAPLLKARSQAFAYFPALDGSSPLETLAAFNAPLLDLAGRAPGFTQDGSGERVFEFYRRLYQGGYTPRNAVTEGHRKAVEMFVAGQVAVVSTGMQFLGFIRSSNAALYRQIGVAPQLASPGAAPGIAAMNLVVPQASKQRELAFRLAAFVAGPQQQLDFARRVPILPSTRASYDDSFFAASAGATEPLALARALSTRHVLAGRVSVPALPGYNKLRSSYARNLQAAMLGAKTSRQALASIDADWRALLGPSRKHSS